MTNPYNMGAYYPESYNNPQYMYPSQVPQTEIAYSKQNGAGSIPLGAITLGCLSGGGVGYMKYRHPVKNDIVSKTFLSKVYDSHIAKNFSKSSKKICKQVDNILKKIDKIKDKSELLKILSKNKQALPLNEMGVSYDSYTSALGAKDFSSSKAILRKNLESRKKMCMTNIQDTIVACWDKEKKKFVKPEGVDSKLFSVINSTKSSLQWKKALKYGSITAGIFGALSIGYRILANKKQ